MSNPLVEKSSTNFAEDGYSLQKYPGRSLCLVAEGRTMAGNWERSERVPVGKTMLKTRARHELYKWTQNRHPGQKELGSLKLE
ncbi:hypothetical protein ILYODFUR_036779 [Ilyodon furcidens]|uniref:Uncharacterized protein n=1 Tax=Ilyodon furcidens TaxID=33524 RepID=A0ABV0V948_9TELE